MTLFYSNTLPMTRAMYLGLQLLQLPGDSRSGVSVAVWSKGCHLV